MFPPNLPQLHVLPLASLVLHEEHDDQRARPLIERLRESGVLRNPPIVSPLQDGSGRYMVLDGANRVTAARMMYLPHIMAQVVEPDDPNLRLMTWNHVVWGMEPSTLAEAIHQIPRLVLKTLKPGKPIVPCAGCLPVGILLPDGSGWVACTGEDTIEQVGFLHAIVNTYKYRAHLDRTSQDDIQQLKGLYSDLTALIVFPNLSIRVLLSLVGQGYILPSGITRFAISPRALHVNYPLEELASASPLEEKEEALQRWLRERLKNKNVRYYAEATFVFDD